MELLIIIITSTILVAGAGYLYYYVTHLEEPKPKKTHKDTAYSSLQDNQRINDKFSLLSLFTGKHIDDNDYEPLLTKIIKFFSGNGGGRYR